MLRGLAFCPCRYHAHWRPLGYQRDKAVAAKTREVHHVDVLGVRPRLEMRLKTTKGGGLKFELGLSIHFAFLLCVCF